MGLISSYSDDAATTDNDRLLTYASDGSTKLTPASNINKYLGDGWTLSGDSWTFSSYNSGTGVGVVNASSGANTKYGLGTSVKFTQPTLGLKYGTVTAATSTTITIQMAQGTVLANEAITLPYYSVGATPFGSGQIPYAKLLSTVFSGQVLTQSNAGSAGGTMYYINLGGIKLLWAISATQSFGAGAPPQSFAVAFTLPTSFFTTVQTVIPSWGPVINTQYVYPSVGATSTSSITVNVNEHNGTSGSGQVQVFVLGT